MLTRIVQVTSLAAIVLLAVSVRAQTGDDVKIVALSEAPQQSDGSAGAPSKPTANPNLSRTSNSPSSQPTHFFWDKENDILFAAVGASRALDYSSTLNLRRRGDNEVFLTNSIVDNHPLFAGIEIAATGASIGVSYLFHRTGHHTLERWTSVVHFGVATGGAIRNYALKTAH